jgi:F0F1-type ATP synthase membrane subunit c/vacuolar-type H+-ATPase subunit K
MNDDPKQTLLVTRIVWAAMIAGQMLFMIVIPFIWPDEPKQTQSPDIMLMLPFVMLVVMVPVGYFIRMQVYKANWREDIVAPGGYFTGNLILLAMCEAVAFMGLVNVQLRGELFPALIPTILALMVQIVNFPNGRAMQRDPLDL